MRRLNYSFLMGAIVLSLAGCGAKETKKAPIRTVRILEVQSENEPAFRTLIPASINEKRETKPAFRVKGPLVYLNDTIGSFVKKGEALATIDPRDYRIAVEATKASYVLAKAEYERYETLLAKKSVSASTFDRVEATLTRAKTTYESAKNALNDTQLRAPFSGYINNVYANNFEEVNPGQAIVSFIDLSSLEVKGWIAHSDLIKINDATQFTCLVEFQGNKFRVPGKLKEIGYKTGMLKQSYPISILIKASETVKLRAGMAAHMEIDYFTMGQTPSVTIPLSCVFTKGGKTFVWMYDAKSTKVAAKEVQSGKLLSNDQIEIITGVQPGDKVICTGTHYLTQGQEVRELKDFTESNVGNKL